MKNKSLFVLVLALLLAVAISGCGGAPATPTKAAATVAPAITVIVTATVPPPLPTLAVPTLTPVATAEVIATVPVTTPVATKATPVPGTPKQAATKKPTVAPTKAAVAPTAIPVKYAAPTPLEPIFGNGRTDSRHYPGEDLVFKWTGVASLAPDECYLVSVTFNPGQGDQFLTQCGNSPAAIGAPVPFTLNRPNRTSPTYSSLLPNAGQDLTVVWSVTVVKDLGLKPDGVHHNTAPLSPPSSPVSFLLKGS